jgi:hypothetical protein
MRLRNLVVSSTLDVDARIEERDRSIRHRHAGPTRDADADAVSSFLRAEDRVAVQVERDVVRPKDESAIGAGADVGVQSGVHCEHIPAFDTAGLGGAGRLEG